MIVNVGTHRWSAVWCPVATSWSFPVFPLVMLCVLLSVFGSTKKKHFFCSQRKIAVSGGHCTHGGREEEKRGRVISPVRPFVPHWGDLLSLFGPGDHKLCQIQYFWFVTGKEGVGKSSIEDACFGDNCLGDMISLCKKSFYLLLHIWDRKWRESSLMGQGHSQWNTKTKWGL